MAGYDQLLEQSIWDTTQDYVNLPDPTQISLSYDRARTVCRQSSKHHKSFGDIGELTKYTTIGITVDDILDLGPKFWDFHRHCMSLR